MSRGLGKNQRLLLCAMRAIETEHGEGEFWSVAYIVERAFELSEELQGLEKRRNEAFEAQQHRIRQLADEGDGTAKTLLALDRSLSFSGRYRGRRRERDWPHWVENRINPSRTLAQLASRGLVVRSGGPGGSWVGLTSDGRNIPL